jgi:G:T-mismatch repair DNA endonuclease (very short patch repair protein)
MTTTPKTRAKFWLGKFAANEARDARNMLSLKAKGWKAEVIWECETRNLSSLERKVRAFLGPPKKSYHAPRSAVKRFRRLAKNSCS